MLFWLQKHLELDQPHLVFAVVADTLEPCPALDVHELPDPLLFNSHPDGHQGGVVVGAQVRKVLDGDALGAWKELEGEGLPVCRVPAPAVDPDLALVPLPSYVVLQVLRHVLELLAVDVLDRPRLPAKDFVELDKDARPDHTAGLDVAVRVGPAVAKLVGDVEDAALFFVPPYPVLPADLHAGCVAVVLVHVDLHPLGVVNVLVALALLIGCSVVAHGVHHED